MQGIREQAKLRNWSPDEADIIASLIPNTRHTARMLDDLGLGSLDDLFVDIPAKVRIGGLRLAPPKSEKDVVAHLARLAAMNEGPRTAGGMSVFLGLGLKERYVPAAVKALVLRSEFYTSYTPYQPEVSQGMLQALFEFQSLITELTGLPVANVSQYDWATAIGEAAIMAARTHEGDRFLVPAAMHPAKKSVIRNYLVGAKVRVEEIPTDESTGTLDMSALEDRLDSKVTGLYIENPNLYGRWEENAHRLKPLLENHDAGILIVGTDPVSLGVARGPGEYGADIVVGELGGTGTNTSLGGPMVGMLAASDELVRRIPGRIVGLTRDSEGRHGFTLTLQTREQHIRRERAMSNICTNQTLCAIAAAIWFSILGGTGLMRLAARNAERAQALRKRLTELGGVTDLYPGPVFEEFALRFDDDYHRLHTALLEQGVHGGAHLGPITGQDDAALLATTEVHDEADHDRLIRAMRTALKEGSA
jgi:glycine dehydrogenase subunit 1